MTQVTISNCLPILEAQFFTYEAYKDEFEVALQFASKYPQFIERLIIYNSLPYTIYTLAKTGYL